MSLPLGIIGCGGHTLHHVENGLTHFHVVNVWDPKNPKAQEQCGCPKVSTTIEELLADKDIAAVFIGSPDEYHLDQIKLALAAGKHVMCEKPLLVPGEQMSELKFAFTLARKKGLVLTTCHPRRFDIPFIRLRSFVHNRVAADFGKVIDLSFDFSYHTPSADWKHHRSLLLDHLNHEVDLMNFLFGLRGFEGWKLADGPTNYHVVGRRDDGITFNFKGTRCLPDEKYHEWCRVRFESGEVELDLMTGVAHLHKHAEGSTLFLSYIAIGYEGRIQRIMKNFLDQIHGQKGYLDRREMLMNAECGIILQKGGIQRVHIRK